MSGSGDLSKSRTRLRFVEKNYYPTVPEVLQASVDELNIRAGSKTVRPVGFLISSRRSRKTKTQNKDGKIVVFVPSKTKTEYLSCLFRELVAKLRETDSLQPSFETIT